MLNLTIFALIDVLRIVNPCTDKGKLLSQKNDGGKCGKLLLAKSEVH